MMSRRTRRADLQQKQPASAFAGTHNTIVSNPIFSYEDGSMTQLKPVDGVLRCGYKEPAGSVQGVTPDVKPLPLPPSRAHRLPAASSRAGPAALVMTTSQHGGWVLRRAPHHDPFLAAYVACTKNGGKADSSPATVKQQHSHRQRKKNESNNTRGDDALQGCGIWSGWAAAAGAKKKKKYAGALSCKHGSAVAVAVRRQGDDDPAQALASPGHPPQAAPFAAAGGDPGKEQGPAGEATGTGAEPELTPACFY